jgi:ribosomal protein S18 acetylase RimI-like enzyme
MPALDHLNIRRAGPEDVATIASFSAAMAHETEGRRLDLDRLHLGTIALIEAPARGFFMVAELEQADDRRLLGQLMVTYEWSDWRNGVFWWIQSVYVDPAWRRNGVYRRLHDTVVEMGKADQKMCGIRLYVARDNRAAQTVYRRVGLTRSMYDVYEDDFVLKHHGP